MAMKKTNGGAFGAGLAIGTALGVAIGNVGLGLALGVVFGAAMANRKKSDEEVGDSQSGSKKG